MKKIFSYLLAVLMMAALLVGCGQQQTDAPGNDEPDQPALADGVYTADFNTDSSMFHTNETCDGKGVLTVKDGQMTIHVSLTPRRTAPRCSSPPRTPSPIPTV